MISISWVPWELSLLMFAWRTALRPTSKDNSIKEPNCDLQKTFYMFWVDPEILILLISSIINNNKASLSVCRELWMRNIFIYFPSFVPCREGHWILLGLVLLGTHVCVIYFSLVWKKLFQQFTRESLGFQITVNPHSEWCI